MAYTDIGTKTTADEIAAGISTIGNSLPSNTINTVDTTFVSSTVSGDGTLLVADGYVPPFDMDVNLTGTMRYASLVMTRNRTTTTEANSTIIQKSVSTSSQTINKLLRLYAGHTYRFYIFNLYTSSSYTAQITSLKITGASVVNNNISWVRSAFDGNWGEGNVVYSSIELAIENMGIFIPIELPNGTTATNLTFTVKNIAGSFSLRQDYNRATTVIQNTYPEKSISYTLNSSASKIVGLIYKKSRLTEVISA